MDPNSLFISNRYATRWKNTVIGYGTRLVSKTTGIRIHLKGTPPKPPFFLASNRLDYIDVIPLWLWLSGTFVAKSEVRSWPFYKELAKRLQQAVAEDFDPTVQSGTEEPQNHL